MQTTHQDDRERQRQDQLGAAGGDGAQPTQAVDPAASQPPPSAEQIARTLSSGLPGYDEGTAALGRKLAREQTAQAGVDALASNRGALWSDLIAAWRTEAAQDETFVKSFGSRDPIAVQKFADIDAEQSQSFEGSLSAAKTGFYGKVAGDIQTAPTARERIFSLLQSAAGPYKFQGAKIPKDQLTAMSRRTHGVGTLYNYALSPAGAAIVDTWARSELALAADMTPAEAANAGLLPDDKAKLEALKHLLRTTYAGDAKSLAEPSASLARAETWYSPAEVSVRAADPDVAFADMMTIGALQPEWYADGALDLTIEPTGVREARKPTAFDGMMSALWVARNQPGQTYGVTGGGAREFLERGVTWAQVKSAVPVIPSDTWMAELARLNAAVKASAPGSSAGEELLRGNDPGVSATAPAYEQVFARSIEEAHNPTTVAGQTAPGGGEAAVAGGTFDTTRTPAPAHALAGPTPSPAPTTTTPPPAAAPGAGAPASAAPAASTPATTAPGAAPGAAPSAARAAPPGTAAAAAPTNPQPAPSEPAAEASAAAGTTAARAPVGGDAAAPGSAAIRDDVAAAPPQATEAAIAADPNAVSRNAAGPAPAGWQAKVVDTIPAAEISPEDAGHTYHLLADGTAVATSAPSLLPRTIAAQVANKLRYFNGKDPTARATEVDADLAKVRHAADMPTYASMVDSLSILASPKSRAQVNLRVGKLMAAIGRARTAIPAKYGPVVGPQKVKEWIDDRMPHYIRDSNTKLQGEATAKGALLKTVPEAKQEHQVDAAWCMVNYDPRASGPEEPATPEMMDASGGIMKVFDVGAAYASGMDAAVKAIWVSAYGDDAAAKAAFIAAVQASGNLVAAPPRLAGDPSVAHLTPANTFTNAIFGFVGQGKDAAGVSSFAGAIKRFALNPGYYPSGAMFACVVPAAEVKAQMAAPTAPKIGKPSIFNLLHFDENVYDETDREFGHLADPSNPHAAGSALELTCLAYPGREFWGKAKLLK